MRRLPILLVALACLALPSAATARPNVVVIETDDQTAADLSSMPQTRALIGDSGVTFDQSIVSQSQCCPSRATFLTGQYAHNHGVLDTFPPLGGFARLDSSESLAVWLQRAGYRTALVGKFLNGYGSADPHEVPPGWDEWHALLGASTYRYYDYAMNHDGAVRTYGTAPTDYQTDVLTGLAEDVVRRRAAAAAPFFLWTTYVAPHTGRPFDLLDPLRARTTVPAPRHRGLFAGVLMPPDPSFNEADVSDKPARISRRPPLRLWQIAALQTVWQQRQEALLAVDEGVHRIVGALRAAGELDDTLIVFTSDNGYMTGQHRDRKGKIVPYEPSIRVPLLLRGPGISAGAVRSQLVWNGDLAPTILDATGARAPWEPDGQSLLPFARDATAQSDRAVLIEAPPRGATFPYPRFTGLRTPRYAYVESASGRRELYDLPRDPSELENLAGTPAAAAVQARLAARLRALRGCAGSACRAGSHSDRT
ncbi:MAG TPA: sulfatase [Solirubrobacteraceae bacterium]|nr:sulfatase [Solirubrobacteraceae bacterium]